MQNKESMQIEEDISELLKLPVDKFLEKINVTNSGLSEEEVKKHREKFGPNAITIEKKTPALLKFLSYFTNPLIIILTVAAFISGIFGDAVDFFLVIIIVILSVSLQFYQERKAENAAELLKEKVTTTATVIRGGKNAEVKFFEIVPGDVITLVAGDLIPADARVIDGKNLYVNQSALTGESVPAEKSSESIIKAESITEWTNFLFLGTSIVSGTATAVVVLTGARTEFGKTAKILSQKPPETEFYTGVKDFSNMIMKVILYLVIFVFAVSELHQQKLLQALMFAVSLAVGLAPDLLPMILTINLSIGALAMSKKGVIVKNLPTIENLGSMDVLCTDKTGTLTENKVTLIKHIDMFGKDDEKVLLFSFINSAFQTGLKSVLDEAIVDYKHLDISDFKKVDEVPFDFVRRRVSVIVSDNKKRYMVIKGATEEIVRICTSYEKKGKILHLRKKIIQEISKENAALSNDGYRVLGIAYKSIEKEKDYDIKDENNMVFLGFVAFIDPPKETAKEALNSLAKLGIEVKVLTGDNELVTRNICRQLDFKIKGVVNGNEIANLDDSALSKVVEQANIFTKVTPADKDRILLMLKKNNHVVGFIGDGINDAPSIKAADAGISVDNAVDVAKESAQIILSRKSLDVLREGILEGRKTFGNTMKYIMMEISSNFGNMLSVAAASLFLPFLPMLPLQILLNNLLYDLANLTIPLDNVDSEYIEKAKRWDIGFIKKYMIFFGGISSLFDIITFSILIIIMKANEPLFQTAWFLESFCTEIIVIFVIRTRISPFWKSKPSPKLVLNTLLMLIIAMAIPILSIGHFFKFIAPPLYYYFILTGLVIAYILMTELLKKWFYRRFAPTA